MSEAKKPRSIGDEPTPGKRRAGRRSVHTTEAEGDAGSKLIEAGLLLFGTNGFHATSTRQIAQEAGLNISLIRYYFGTKEGLYRACLDAVKEAHIATISSFLTPAKDAKDLAEKLETFIDASLHRLAAKPHISRLISRSVQDDWRNLALADAVKPLALNPIISMGAFLQAAKELGAIKNWVDPILIATTISGFIWHQITIDAFREKVVGKSVKDQVYRKELARTFVAGLVSGITN